MELSVALKVLVTASVNSPDLFRCKLNVSIWIDPKLGNMTPCQVRKNQADVIIFIIINPVEIEMTQIVHYCKEKKYVPIEITIKAYIRCQYTNFKTVLK